MLRTKKQPAYRRIVSLLEQPKTLLASMLISNSFVNIGIILISNILIDSWISWFALKFLAIFLIKVGSVTFLLVLFGEVLPKVWATHHKIWFAATASLIVEIFTVFFIGSASEWYGSAIGLKRNFLPKILQHGSAAILDYAIDLLPEHEATTEEKQF